MVGSVQDRYRLQFETALDGIIIADYPTGRLLDVNKYLSDWLGYSRNDLLDQVLWSLPAWKNPESVRAITEPLERHGTVFVEHVELVSSAGEQFSASIVGNTYFEGFREVLQLNIRDVTGRLRTEQALRESEERFRLFSENAVDYGLIFTNLDGLVVFWSTGSERLFGYSAEEMQGRSAAIIFTAAQRSAKEPALEMKKAAQEGRADDEKWHVRKDGTQFWASGVMTSLRDAAGELRGYAKVIRDATERKMAEEALARKANELARSNIDLQQFAYISSHDLQEPLRTIITYSELLLNGMRERLTGEEQEFFGFITSAAGRMRSLIHDLLNYSRVGSEAPESDVPVDLNESLRWALMNLQIPIAETRAAIHSDPLPSVLGTQVQFTQLFQNLIGNAIRYCGEQPPAVRVSVERDGKMWIFSVRDNGIGIDPCYRDSIFGLFKRLHGSDRPGNGIGLTLCKKIVERHGGIMWVESERGKGSDFKFTLPVTEPNVN